MQTFESWPAVVRYRGSEIETVHRASVAVADARGRLVARWGDPERMTWLRSANKPFQALPTVETGAADRFGLTEEELALICSSHSAEDGHVAGVVGILKKLGLEPAVLRCGAHPPMHEPTMFRVGAAYNRLHSDCSGKHAGMLALARHLGVAPRKYLERSTPSQRLIRTTVAELAGLAREDVKVAIDGCGAPTFAVPLRNAATAYARLATGEGFGAHREALLRLRDAMMRHPWMVGGTGRLDTELMGEVPGVVSKSGAAAFLGVAILPRRLGVAIKIEDGTPEVMGLVAFEVLKQLRVLREADRPRLGPRTDLRIYNYDRTVTGRSRVVLRLQRP